MSPNARVILAVAVSLSFAGSAAGQPRFYVGGTVGLMTQTQQTTPQQLGGTTWCGSALVGVHVSPRLAVEVESSFGGEFQGEAYTYLPSPSLRARVVSNGRDTFFAFQARSKVGVLEPVAGLTYVRSRANRHATFVPGGRTYFDDERIDNNIAFSGGLDAAFRVAPRFFVVPTFRAFAILRPSPSPSGTRVRGAPVVLRYGAGARVTF